MRTNVIPTTSTPNDNKVKQVNQAGATADAALKVSIL